MPKKKTKESANEKLHEKHKVIINPKEIYYEEIALILSEYWQSIDSLSSDPTQKRF